jgi:hypothetical protein
LARGYKSAKACHEEYQPRDDLDEQLATAQCAQGTQNQHANQGVALDNAHRAWHQAQIVLQVDNAVHQHGDTSHSKQCHPSASWQLLYGLDVHRNVDFLF